MSASLPVWPYEMPIEENLPRLQQPPKLIPSDYAAAIESLGGLRLVKTPISKMRTPGEGASSSSSLDRNASAKPKRLAPSASLAALPDRKQLVNVRSMPNLPTALSPVAFQPGKLSSPPQRAVRTAKTPASLPTPVTLPPLKLSLKVALRGGTDGTQDNESEEDEEEEELSDEDERVVALGAFNERHSSNSLVARNLLNELEVKKRTIRRPRAALGFDHRIGEVFRNRLYVAEKYDPFAAARVPMSNQTPGQSRSPRKRKKHKRWRLADSIWHPRKLYGNSLDYYETQESLRSVFDCDWAIASIQLARLIERADVRGSDFIDEDGNGTHDALDSVAAVLWENARLMYGLFDYYAILLDAGKDKEGEIEISQISYNAYVEFTRDCKIIGSTCPQKTVDLIWTTVNALPQDTFVQKIDRYNHRRLMTRHEFMQALVRFSVTLFMGKSTADGKTEVARAVSLLLQKLKSVAPPEALQDSNVFRKKTCYQQLTDASLRRHLTSLRSIFDVYARSNRDKADDLQDASLMSIGEWLALLEHVGFLEMGQVSYFGAKIIFKWSMIRATPDHSSKSERKMRNLTFLDFCEAIVRLACIVALPTDAELEEAKAEDAGEYLHALMDGGSGEMSSFVAERKTGWQSQPRQHVSRCVHHLVSILTRTILSDVGHGEVHVRNGVTLEDAENFESRRKQGRTLHHVQAAGSMLDGIRAAQSIIRARLLTALQKVEIFSVLSVEQIETLCGAMSQAKFDEGEYVFEQGDDGDAFYIITEGQAVVLRNEPGEEVEKELATLGEGAFFGERALIKNQVRYAGIQALTPQLYAVCITRNEFEIALGTKLENLVPDQYNLDAAELVKNLATVPLFVNLTSEQVQNVADRCTEIKFKKGQDVIRQGDTGDALYMITRGTADVLRVAEEGDKDYDPSQGEKILAQLSTWRAFGDRALIKNEKRFATVRATSDELHLMTISRDVMEGALGAKLSEVLEDRYD